MERILKTVLYTISLMFCLVVSLFIVMPVLNNYRLGNFANQIENISLPLNIYMLEKKSLCGKLNGNGNGMDFLVCALVKSDLPLNSLREYFSGLTYAPVKDDANHKTVIEVLHATEGIVKTKYLEHGDISFENLKNVKDYSNYYILVLYDGGYSADFDIRGH